MRVRLAPFSLTALLAVLTFVDAEARVQGAKGRRLQVFHDLEPYRGGVVFLEEPEVVTNIEDSVVKVEGLRWYAHQFLETRLRELAWEVRPWYDEFGAVAREHTDERALVVDCTLFFEVSGRKGEWPLSIVSPFKDNRLAVEVFLRDFHSGRVVGRFQGYGRALVRSIWPGARDDLQEISRVFTAYLAEELKVGQPKWTGYESEPYRRRDRGGLKDRMLRIDKDRDLPRAVHHLAPPINDEARERREPLEIEIRDPRR